MTAIVSQSAWAAAAPLPGQAADEPGRTVSIVCLILAPVVLLVLSWRGIITPRGMRRHRVRDLRPYPAWAWFFVACGVFFAQIAGMSAAYGLLPWPRDVTSLTMKGQGVMALGATGVGVIVAIGLSAIMGRAIRGRALRIGPMDGPIAIGCLALALPVVWAVSSVSSVLWIALSGQEPDVIVHDTLRSIADDPGETWAIVLGACAVIGAPIIEEVIFRVGVQSALLKVSGNPFLSVLATSVAFGAVHADVAQPVAIPTLTVLGFALGAAYERTGRLGVPILMHMLFNALNVALAVWG